MTIGTDKLLVERTDGIGWLVFNQPEKRNAISFEMWQHLPAAMAELEGDAQVRVIVVRGAGDKAFSAGADISEFGERRSTAQDRALYEEMENAAVAALTGGDKLTIAMIDGVCVGGGAEMAMDCDILIAADRARFAVTPARLGIGYRHQDVARLIRHVGPKFTKEILASGRFFTAEEAKGIGWINHVVPAAELEAFVLEYANGIAANAPFSVRAAKLVVNELVKPPEERDYDLCNQVVDDCYESQDYIEGQAAFAEKRPPDFKGV